MSTSSVPVAPEPNATDAFPLIAAMGYLSDESRVTRGPVEIAGRSLEYLAESDRGYVAVFEAANLLALGLFRSRRHDDARALCLAELSWASTWEGHRDWGRVLVYALQPRINLLRLHGYAGDLESAIRGYAELTDVAIRRRPLVLDGPPSLSSWSEIGDDWGTLYTLVRDATVSDTCKMLSRRADSQTLERHARMLVSTWSLRHGRGAQHALETPWLLGLEQDPETALQLLLRSEDPGEQRSAAVQLLHWCRHHGPEESRECLAALEEHWGRIVAGPFLSALTRWRLEVALGELLVELDDNLAARHFGTALDGLESGEDPALARQLSVLLVRPCPTAPPVPRPTVSLDEALTTVLARLDSAREGRSRLSVGSAE